MESTVDIHRNNAITIYILIYIYIHIERYIYIQQYIYNTHIYIYI